MPERVLAISSHAGTGGSELTFATFLSHRPGAVEPTVLLLADGPLRERVAELGLEPRVAPGCVGRPGPRMAIGLDRQLAALLRERAIDVVWAMGVKAALLSVSACRRRRIPLVWHKVDFSWDRPLAIPLAAACTGVIAVSEAVAAPLGPMRRRRLATVGPPTALAHRPSRPEPGSPPVIGTLGRLVPYKGHHLIVEAAGLLSAEHPTLRVLLAGEPHPKYPDYPARLREAAALAGLEGRLELPGFQPPERVLGRISVFVNATHRDREGFGLEGLSGAMLEASWAGLPVVATAGGGTAEGVRDGVTGTLVERPAAAELAAAISPYLRDPDLAAQTGVAGRRFARAAFDPEVVSARLWDALAAVAASNH